MMKNLKLHVINRHVLCCSWTPILLVLTLANENSVLFDVEPTSVVQAEGLIAVFECFCSAAYSHHWALNGQFLDDDQFPDDVIRITPRDSSAKLLIPATSEYNNTIVQCKVLFHNESQNTYKSVLSVNATLTVQGPLPTVTSLHFDSTHRLSSNSISISWNPPFSLNLTTAEPDIQYCVDVYDGVYTIRQLIKSMCNITQSTFTFKPSNPDFGRSYIFVVIPRSNVEGSHNGTMSDQILGYLCQDRPHIQEITFSADVYLNQAIISINNQQNDALCRVTNSFLEIRSPSGSEEASKNNTNFCPLSSLITQDLSTRSFNFSCIIERHKLYSIRIYQDYNGGSVKSDWITISTHDVQNPSVQNGSEPGQLITRNSYLLETVDLGSFFVLWPMRSHSSEIIYRSGQRSIQETVLTIANLSSSMYQVFIFDIEPNGHPRSLPAALPQFVSLIPAKGADKMMTDFIGPSSSSLRVSINYYGGIISISCSFSANELTGCVGVIHSAQLDNFALTVLSVERSGGVDSTNINEGNYSVAVFGQKHNRINEFPSLVQIVSASPITTTISGGVVEDNRVILSTTITLIVVMISFTSIILTLVIVFRIKMNKRKNKVQIEDSTKPSSHNELKILNFSQHQEENLHSCQEPLVGRQNSELDAAFCTDNDTKSLLCIEPSPSSVGRENTDGYNNMEANQSLSISIDLENNTMTQNIKKAEIQTPTTQSVICYAEIDVPDSSSYEEWPGPHTAYPEDHTAVIYSEVTTQKSPQCSNTIEVQPITLQALPLHPTAETVLSDILPIAENWKKFGEALEIPEHILDNISMEGSDPVRLHEVVHYYFNSTQFTHTWEEIVRALWKIEETEASDKIVRTRKLPIERSNEDEIASDSMQIPQKNNKLSSSYTQLSNSDITTSSSQTLLKQPVTTSDSQTDSNDTSETEKSATPSLFTAVVPPPCQHQTFPQPTTVQCMVFELQPIAGMWDKFGEALGITKRKVDSIATKLKDSCDQTKLYEVVRFYFTIQSEVPYPKDRVEIVKALWKIREADLAEEIIKLHKLKALLPSPLTAESVVSELLSISKRWYDFGEALGLLEHILEGISKEGSNQNRLRNTVHYYFNTHTASVQEDIVRVLNEIGETEAANKIKQNYTISQSNK